jgi:serine/threonine protein kinase
VHNPKDNLRKTLCGTPLYLAPEFITTCKYNDAIDIWSLGIMAYELFTHEFPFKIESVNDLIKIVNLYFIHRQFNK